MRGLCPSPRRSCWAATLLGAAGLSVTRAYTLDVNSTDSIRSISSQLVDDTINEYYVGHLPGQEPGLILPPHFWWEGGALMGTLISYWYYTGDTKYVNLTTAGLLAQVGEYNDYMPKAQRLNEGNDDQGFWGMAVMAAAEYKFPDPPRDKPQWLALAQAVFNTQASRWDPTCGGGLRWQIYQVNKGYDYKNTISQGCFFNIAARLALYTGNHSYAEWAERAWDWTRAVGFIDDDYNVYDGAHVPQNCTNTVPFQWTYNHGSFMHGVAAMYNYSRGAEREKWRVRLDGLVNQSSVFFPQNDIMVEIPCEPVDLCNLDQQSFKAYLARWMYSMTKWAPWTYDRIMPRMRATAIGATMQCNAGHNGRLCGMRWNETGRNDGSLGLGQQMAVLEATVGLLTERSADPVTDKTGGTSIGDPGAGGADMGFKDQASIIAAMPPITTADMAGAWILTLLALCGLMTGIALVVVDETDGKSWPERWSDLGRSVKEGGLALAAAGGRLHKPHGPGNDDKGKSAADQPGLGGMITNDGASDYGGGEKYDSRVTVVEPGSGFDFGLLAPARPSQQRPTQSPPQTGKPLPQLPLSPQQQQKRKQQLLSINSLHRKSHSMPAWSPNLEILPAPPVASPGEGFRRSASQQIKRSSLKKRLPPPTRPFSVPES